MAKDRFDIKEKEGLILYGALLARLQPQPPLLQLCKDKSCQFKRLLAGEKGVVAY